MRGTGDTWTEREREKEREKEREREGGQDLKLGSWTEIKRDRQTGRGKRDKLKPDRQENRIND